MLGAVHAIQTHISSILNALSHLQSRVSVLEAASATLQKEAPAPPPVLPSPVSIVEDPTKMTTTNSTDESESLKIRVEETAKVVARDVAATMLDEARRESIRERQLLETALRHRFESHIAKLVREQVSAAIAKVEIKADQQRADEDGTEEESVTSSPPPAVDDVVDDVVLLPRRISSGGTSVAPTFSTTAASRSTRAARNGRAADSTRSRMSIKA